MVVAQKKSTLKTEPLDLWHLLLKKHQVFVIKIPELQTTSTSRDKKFINYIWCIRTFDALIKAQYEYALARASLKDPSWCKHVHLKTHRVTHCPHQNLVCKFMATALWKNIHRIIGQLNVLLRLAGTWNGALHETCGQSLKSSTSVNYDSRVVLTSKLLIFSTLES